MIDIDVRNLRLYFNRAEDVPRVWSIDFHSGSGSPRLEILVCSVHASAPSTAMFVDSTQPRAWMQFCDVHLQVTESGHAKITPRPRDK